ncbi:MAG: carboxypeptidase regulatory-like domain-containing protein [Gemmatimonadales bacterium]
MSRWRVAAQGSWSLIRATIAIAAMLSGASSLVAQQPMATVRGLVRDVTGRPLADAEIVVGRRSATTGAAGRFTLDSLSPARHLLVVRLIGYVPLRQEVDLTRGSVSDLQLELILAPAYLPTIVVEGARTGIYGTVGAFEAGPAAGARVEVRGPRGGEMVTDSLGGFSFPRATRGAYVVRVTQPGFIERRIMLEVTGGKELAVTLVPGFTMQSSAAERAVADLSQRLILNLDRERMGSADLAIHGDARLCDMPKARIAISDDEDAVLFVNGIRYFRSYGDGLLQMLCAWRADEVELLEFGSSLMRDVTGTLAFLVGVNCSLANQRMAASASGVRARRGGSINAGISCLAPYVVVWEKR